jgi:hypothetical protein
MNPNFKIVLELKEHIKKDHIRDGIPLTILVWALCKEANYNLHEAKKSYNDDKNGFAKKYEKLVNDRNNK